ncbi:protein translocase SecDF, variant type [Williamsoniiplasma lucivorax]|uniref:Bifunctional preprotein translocase subunit SecD/SecF n=1 Tax=Williamsoniiplasma lucivorax TaxID=209274 RepID=A0A2S5RCY2_9MOLU|nr:protein translocase SecDF, variant type [Williamsoniiplasma lucivorax]PPE05189.1 bifunctional preprotein translocase subunit SecD/SecF [Williamsoniiplasma lucivorax]
MKKKKNKKKIETKKIIHIVILAFILVALVFGLVFSAIQTSTGIHLGSQYKGGYKAVVNIFKSERNDKDEGWSLKPGDAKKGAEALQSKLSPFSDGNITVDIAGKSRAIVFAPRERYQNNKQLFINDIQSTGGLFILKDNQDVMLNKDLMTAAGLDGTLDKKSATGEIVGPASATSQHIGQGNFPFIQFALKNDHLKKMIEKKEDKPTTRADAVAFTFLVDAPNVLDTFRNYLNFIPSAKEEDKFLETLVNSIGAIRSAIEKAKEEDKANATAVFKDFFKGTRWKLTSSGSWVSEEISLYDEQYSKNTAKLKEAFFANGDEKHKFVFKSDINKYIYDSNSIGVDFDKNKAGRYSKDIDYDGKTMNVTKAFNILTQYMIPQIYDATQKDNKFLHDFKPELFKNNFIFSGAITEENQSPNIQGASLFKNNFYIATKNYTTATEVSAKIAQTTENLIFTVMSVNDVDAIISNTMFIVSLVALMIILIAIAIFILFFYRLLGLFTIIIAAIIGSLTVLMSVIFSIAFGPEFIAILFIVIGLTFDISIVLFESFKNNIYIEKRPMTMSFNISHKETLGIVIDVLLATILPSIILFWIGTGFLKNFATITALGIFFVFIFGIIVLRLMIYLTTKTRMLNKHPWMLPIDTSVEYQGSFFFHNLIEYKEEKLDAYALKNQLNSKQLVKIKKLQDQIEKLKIKNTKIHQKKLARIEKHNQQQLKKIAKNVKSWKLKLTKLEKKKNFFARYNFNHLTKKIQYVSHLSDEIKAIGNDEKKIKENRIVKLENKSKKIGILTLIFTGLFLAIAAIVSGVAGFNYTPSFGSGTTTYIQGEFVKDFQTQVKNPGGIDFKFDEAKNKTISDELLAIDKQTQNEILPGGQGDDHQKNLYTATSVERMYRYLFDNNYLDKLLGPSNNIRMKNLRISSGPDYSYIDPSWSIQKFRPWVAFDTTSNIIHQSTALRNTIYHLAGNSGNYKPDDEHQDGQILVMTIAPLTTFLQIKEILITILIVLLALIVYMLIRFKWTYYVALALGIVIALTCVVSVVLVLRIPFSIEILAGAMAVISFAFATGILFLGKGKSIIKSKNDKDINESFSAEIDLQLKIKHLKANLRKRSKQLRMKFKEQTKIIKDKKLCQTLKTELKNEKRTLVTQTRLEIYEIKKEIKIESNKNKFLSEIFDKVFKFGIYRAMTISVLYMLTGLVLAVTLPSIPIMGATILIGVPITIIVMLSIVLPIWVKLERKRIYMKYSYKKFVNNMHVSAEEQIIEGIND